MLEFNLSQRERQILIQLIDLASNSKEQFEARIADLAGFGPGRELARIPFGCGGASMSLTKRDLRLLKDEGLIHFHWHTADHGTGRLSSLGLDAVSRKFHANEADAAALALAADKRAVAADEAAIV